MLYVYGLPALDVYSVLVKPPLGDCHVAFVPDVAVNTWPTVGALAALTATVVVAVRSEFAVMVFVASVSVLLVNVSTPSSVDNVPEVVGIVKITV
jgi:hypothetical protein